MKTYRTESALSLLLVLTACATITTPPKPAEIPAFSFAALQGKTVALTVIDQRKPGERDAGWEELVRSDVTNALTRAGVTVSGAAATHMEIGIVRAQADQGGRRGHVWNGCVQLTGQLTGAFTTDAVGDACVTQPNEGPAWGIFDAKETLHLAYEDALSRVLSGLDKKLH